MASDMIFISYSRQDSEFVTRLTNDLKNAGFNIWVDTESLEPGTASWERAIREAIKDSAAIVLVASPDALQSDYVQGELTVAKLLNRPIYPIWANGENWIDCVPLDMANYQYVDGRRGEYPHAIETIKQRLGYLADTSKGATSVFLPNYQKVEIDLTQFVNFQDFLDHLFFQYVGQWYHGRTYGKDWVLANLDTNQLLLPWQWLALEDGVSMSRFNPLWANDSLESFGIFENTLYGVWNLTNFIGIGVALNSSDLIAKVQSNYTILEFMKLSQNNIINISQDDPITSIDYKFTTIIGIARNDWNILHQFYDELENKTIFVQE